VHQYFQKNYKLYNFKFTEKKGFSLEKQNILSSQDKVQEVQKNIEHFSRVAIFFGQSGCLERNDAIPPRAWQKPTGAQLNIKI